jgi:hypothetical protein
VRIVAQTPKPSVSLPLFAQVLEDLLREGLIWTHTLREGQPGSAKIDFTGGRYVYIPKEVARHLPPLPIKQSPAPLIAQTLEGSARTCQRDLYLLWSAARETPLQLVNAGLLRIGDLKRVAGQLLVPETIVTGGKEFDYRRPLLSAPLGDRAGCSARGFQLESSGGPARALFHLRNAVAAGANQLSTLA